MMLAFVGSTTILLIERPKNAFPVYVPLDPVPGEFVVMVESWEGTCVQVSPPSVDPKIPKPASESADAFGSPVPA
jgi:hypothetical protein